MTRSSGVLMHVSSLFGDYSCGSFGKEARSFVDFLADCGFSKWQVLPFCMPDEYHSPYKSYSAFGGNPYFIDLEILSKEGLITKNELAQQRNDAKRVDYGWLFNTRYANLQFYFFEKTYCWCS